MANLNVGNKIRIIKGIGKGKLAVVEGIQMHGLCTANEFMVKVKIINPNGRVKYRYLWSSEMILNPSRRSRCII